MAQWFLDSMQYIILIVAAVASISVEWRRPGLIVSGFALLSLTLARPLFDGASINALFREADSGLFMLMWVMIDLLGALLIMDYCYPSKDNKSFRPRHWAGISGLMLLCSGASFMNFCYTMGYVLGLPTRAYDPITVIIAASLILIVFVGGTPGGVYALKDMVSRKLAGSSGGDIKPASQVRRPLYREPWHQDISWFGGRRGLGVATHPVDDGRSSSPPGRRDGGRA